MNLNVIDCLLYPDNELSSHNMQYDYIKILNERCYNPI